MPFIIIFKILLLLFFSATQMMMMMTCIQSTELERVNVDLHDCTRTHAVVAWNEKAALFSRSCMML